jgi:hypothetical protein
VRNRYVPNVSTGRQAQKSLKDGFKVEFLTFAPKHLVVWGEVGSHVHVEIQNVKIS